MTYFESKFNGIIMIILNVGIEYDLCGFDCQKKIYKYFELSFSCFGSFRVWGVINIPMSRIESKYKTKEKNVSFFLLKCIVF